MSIEVNDARQQAVYKLEGIKEMMERLKHVESCSDDECQLAVIEMVDAIGESRYTTRNTQDIRLEYHDHDDALEAIQESQLSVEVRSGWYGPGSELSDMQPVEYQILLCTDGPAVRLVGKLSRYSEPRRGLNIRIGVHLGSACTLKSATQTT